MKIGTVTHKEKCGFLLLKKFSIWLLILEDISATKSERFKGLQRSTRNEQGGTELSPDRSASTW